MKRLLSAALLASIAGTSAFAQSSTTRIVIGFAPGGPVDSIGRIVSEQLAKELDTTIVIENKAGANGAIAANDVKRAAPDGRTLWFTSVGAAVINRWLSPNVSYDTIADFTAISVVVNNDELLVVNKNNPASTVPQFVAASKAAKDPLPMASSGLGSIPHLAIEQLADATGARLVHVPYRGAAPAINDVASGAVAAFFGDVAGLIGNIGPEGLLKPIGLAALKRHPVLPDVPTLDEQGIKGIDTNNWYALYGPAKMTPETLARLNAAVRNSLRRPPTAERLIKLGAEPAPSTPEELVALQKRDSEKWGKLIQAKGIKVP